MEKMIYKIFVRNWPRKAAAILIAFVVWFFVNHSLIATKTISNIPIRVINLPQDKTIIGLLPNGLLKQRITLTLSGTKDVITELEPSDLEVLVDASQAPQDEWIVNITKRNLVSMNPSINLLYNITRISQAELFIKLSPLITRDIPVQILHPKGSIPDDFELLDIWPMTLHQTLSGPQEEIEALLKKGLKLQFDLDQISHSELIELYEKKSNSGNEAPFFIPDKWKKVTIPFRHNSLEEINDPLAEYMRMDFLKKEYLPLDRKIQIDIFYPLVPGEKINPSTYSLEKGNQIASQNGLSYLTTPLYIRNVSIDFMTTIRDYLKVFIIAEEHPETQKLRQSTQVLGMRYLEDQYVAKKWKEPENQMLQEKFDSRDNQLRKRFRKYMHRLELFTAPDLQLIVNSRFSDGVIEVD